MKSLVVILLILASCSKSSQLKNQPWRLVAVVQGGVNQILPCDTNDTWTFTDTGVVNITIKTKCPTFKKDYTRNYSLSEDEKAIFLIFNSQSYMFTILELNSASFSAVYKDKSSDLIYYWRK